MELDYLEYAFNYIYDFLVQFSGSETFAYFLYFLIASITISIVVFITNFVIQKTAVKAINKVVVRSKNTYDDVFVERKFFKKIAYLIPAFVFFRLSELLFKFMVHVQKTFIMLGKLAFVFIIVQIVVSILNSIYDILNKNKKNASYPIKGYVQMAVVVVYFFAVLAGVSVLFNISMLAVFTGLGALATVLLLVFRDTLLGITASIQLTANDMVKIGDWITMPSANVDGDVIEITLYAIKVRNFDKTISTIPPYDLITKSFTNWKGMQESGGRRIKRSINIDMKSVVFCTEQMLEKFSKIHLLTDYIESRSQEIIEYNKEHGIDASVTVNGRRLTNIGVFRQYVENYLLTHKDLHKELTAMVRQLQPTELGIPIEVYTFTRTTKWIEYENVQSDIFDHLLAVIPEFELRVFQVPTGDDFRRL